MPNKNLYLVHYNKPFEYEGDEPDMADPTLQIEIWFLKKQPRVFSIERNGERIKLEYIKKRTYLDRQRVLVYKDTPFEYNGKVPTVEDENVKILSYFDGEKNIKSFSLMQENGETYIIESITHAALVLRQPVWVYKNTNLKYDGVIPESEDEGRVSILKRYHNGAIQSFSLAQDNNDPLVIESVSLTTFRQRKFVWGCESTGFQYDVRKQLLKPENVLETTSDDGMVKSFSLAQDNGQSLIIEYITNAANKRQKTTENKTPYLSEQDIQTSLAPVFLFPESAFIPLNPLGALGLPSEPNIPASLEPIMLFSNPQFMPCNPVEIFDPLKVNALVLSNSNTPSYGAQSFDQDGEMNHGAEKEAGEESPPLKRRRLD